MNFSEKSVIEIIRDDKDRGIKLLFDHYYRPLVLYADEFLNDLVAAEDLVQEMFVKLWEAEHPLEGISTSLGGYLYTSVKNSCYTYTHKKDILRNTEEFEGVDIPVELVADLTEERIDQVMGAVEELPERTRKVVEAVMIRNLKYREVAEELSISINTVKFLLKDGMRRLRSRFTSVGGIMLFFLSRKLLERRS